MAILRMLPYMGSMLLLALGIYTEWKGGNGQ